MVFVLPPSLPVLVVSFRWDWARIAVRIAGSPDSSRKALPPTNLDAIMCLAKTGECRAAGDSRGLKRFRYPPLDGSVGGIVAGSSSRMAR